MEADKPETHLPHMAVCSSIKELYQVMREDQDLQLAVCFEPNVPKAATNYACWLAEQTSFDIRADFTYEGWDHWFNQIRTKCSLGKKPPQNTSLPALLEFFEEVNEASGDHNLLAAFAVGESRFNTQGQFHTDRGGATLLHSFCLASTWHIPRNFIGIPNTLFKKLKSRFAWLRPNEKFYSQIRTVPIGATTLHRASCSNYFDPTHNHPIDVEKQNIHATPVAKGNRAAFALAQKYKG
jgi:hypothetical protein